MKQFFETMFFTPKWYHYITIVLLFPLSLLYGSLMWLRRIFTKKIDFDIPITAILTLINYDEII